VEAPDRGGPRIGLLGGGAQAREIASYLPAGTDVFYAVNPGYQGPTGARCIDLEHPPAEDVSSPVVGAVGAPGLRRDMVSWWPGTNFAVVRAESAHVDETSLVGPGTVIAPHAVVSVGVRIDSHVQINIGATLSHDVSCGAFVTISPGVNVAGRADIGEGAFLGVGATIVNGVRIAPGVVVGAGAVVLRDVDEPDAVVVGVPARVVGHNRGWLRVI
jgi:sugar O-acyltransferase (sialic acid O-acetyltransferase NeuD family)